MSLELPMVLQALECLLGGTPDQEPPERRLSEIDWALARGLLDSIVAQLALAWRDLGHLGVSLADLEVESDTGSFAPSGEPTLALTLRCTIGRSTSRPPTGSPDQESPGGDPPTESATPPHDAPPPATPHTILLLIPWSAIEPVANEILGRKHHSEEAASRERQAVRKGLAGAEVLLRAEIGAARIPVEQMLALAPGSLLTLEGRAEEGIQLYAEGVPLAFAAPGLRGARRAIRLTSTETPGAGGPVQGPFGSFETHEDRPGAPRPPAEQPHTLTELRRLRHVPVRVWAELGRTHLALGHALELPVGTVLELEQSAEDPIELFVNGMPLAHASLQVTPEGEWAVQVDELL
jgi:flagellar motor switch protein FliM